LVTEINEKGRTGNQHVEISKRGKKITDCSSVLGRDFHVDHFVPKAAPRFHVILFGGSGVTEEEYLRRADVPVPLFDPWLDELEKEQPDTPFCFTYITAPYDIAYRNMTADEEMQGKWAAHIRDEVLPALPDLPIYWIGYSGGFLLGWYGLEDEKRCFGAGTLGGDQLFRDLCCPPWWREPLTLYYNPGDPVFRNNKAAISELTAGGEAENFQTRSGSHALADYLKNQSFSGLVRRAA
jgi:hypothetical protein